MRARRDFDPEYHGSNILQYINLTRRGSVNFSGYFVFGVVGVKIRGITYMPLYISSCKRQVDR